MDIDKLITDQKERLAAKEDLSFKIKHTSNEDFVVDLMNFSPFGGMAQVFIMEAIRFYSKIVSETLVDSNIPDHGIISKKLWNEVAKDIHQKVSERNKEE